MTHFLSPPILREMRKITLSSQGLGDAWLLYQGDTLPAIVRKKGFQAHRVSIEDLYNLGYDYKNIEIIPGKAHFPLLHFFRHQPDYDYYCIIEYDVRFTGSWQQLFRDINSVEADFLTSHILHYPYDPNWPHWDLSHPHKNIPAKERIRGYNPIFRVSNRALAQVDKAHKDNWRGHNEVLLTTLLDHNGLEILDFNQIEKSNNSSRELYIPTRRNSKGTTVPGTIRYRPVHNRSPYLPDKLYHPVKPMESQPWTWSLSRLAHHIKIWLEYLRLAIYAKVGSE